MAVGLPRHALIWPRAACLYADLKRVCIHLNSLCISQLTALYACMQTPATYSPLIRTHPLTPILLDSTSL